MSASRDPDFDSDFDEDDEEIRRIQMQMMASRTSQSKQDYAHPKQVVPSHEVLSGIVQTFQRTPGGKCILDYIKSGSEINQALRSGDPRYKDTVSCLEKYSKPLKELIAGNFDYIVLYRNMTSKYDSGKSAGFISTANVPVPGFGVTTKMKVYVPMNTKVLVGDITSLVKNPGSSASLDLSLSDKVFEFILPRGTTLSFMGENDKGVQFYSVNSGNDVLDRMIHKQMLSDFSSTQS